MDTDSLQPGLSQESFAQAKNRAWLNRGSNADTTLWGPVCISCISEKVSSLPEIADKGGTPREHE